MKHPATMSRIHLELARTPKYPDGSAEHGYEFRAPLTAEGHVDLGAWRQKRDACTVTRFWANSPEEQGRLLHVCGGWCFDYGAGETEDEEPFYTLDRHSFTPGAYVTITERWQTVSVQDNVCRADDRSCPGARLIASFGG